MADEERAAPVANVPLPQGPAERTFLVVVDDTPEMHVALRFAARRALRTNGRVALLYVMEPAEFRHWLGVEERMRAERREEAERVLQGLAAEINAVGARMPILHVREGKPAEEILRLIEEEPSISILVLGAGTEKKGPGPLVSSLAGKMSGRFPIPITVVPGTLTDSQIDELT
ncbi:MAG: universal stress protein [Alphaproteobacteria bacterium]|nr:universal stress protein [Alphaproteobacteria bacterium]